MKKLLSLLLITLLATVAGTSVLAQTQRTEDDVKLAKRIRKLIHKAGVGIDDQLDVSFKDGTTASGYINEATEETFVLKDKTTGALSTFRYDDVREARVWSLTNSGVRKERRKLGSSAIKVGIGIAIGFAALLTACAVTKRCQE